MRTFANGWTKDTVRERVKKYNDGSRAVKDFRNVKSTCQYQTETGNRCFIGAFIPDEHEALTRYMGVEALLNKYPDLISLVPFNNATDLGEFQASHDLSYMDPNPDTYIALEEFLKGCED